MWGSLEGVFDTSCVSLGPPLELEEQKGKRRGRKERCPRPGSVTFAARQYETSAKPGKKHKNAEQPKIALCSFVSGPSWLRREATRDLLASPISGPLGTSREHVGAFS